VISARLTRLIGRVDTSAFVGDGYVAVYATWPHRGTAPRLMVQPGIAVPDGFALDGSCPSPVARAIVRGLVPARG
jgi:hypothetical protein